MGLFDKVKKMNDSYKQDINEKKRIKKEKEERRERIRVAREENEKKIMEKLQIEKEKKENDKKSEFGEENNILENEITKICLNCNKKYPDSNKFCNDCGEELIYIFRSEEKIKNVINKIIESIKEDIKEKFLKQNLSFRGCDVIKSVSYETIETPLIKNKHGTGTKVLATAVAGPLGFVATNGIKQEISTKEIKIDGEYLHFNVNLGDKHIVYTEYTSNSDSHTFIFGKSNSSKIIINWSDVDYIDDEYYLMLKNHEVLKFPILSDKELVKNMIKKIAKQEALNEEIIEKYYLSIEAKIDKYYKELINNKAKNSNKDSNIDINSDLNELEKLCNLYEKGLLTDEEFDALKKKLI